MFDLSELIGHWGYVAIFVLVVFGNMGVPVPEETILVLAGYMIWHGELRWSIVLLVGIVGACGGDNIGYWLGRRYGRAAVDRNAPWVLGDTHRLARMRTFVERRGPLAVFVARFVPGLRFLAGPLAGALGLGFTSFLTANLLGALVFVPTVVGMGYAVGYGVGGYVEPMRRFVGSLEHLVLLVAFAGAAVVVAWRALKYVRARRRGV
jgi:membrane protein DedA with SNARE-associated domain